MIPGLAHATGHAPVSDGAGPRLAAVRVLARVHLVRVHRVAPPTVLYREGLERVIRRFLAIHALLTLKAALVEAGGVVLVLALRRERRERVQADRQAQAARAERRRSGARSEAPVKQDPHAGSVARRSIEARQILARFSDASFPTYLFLYSLLYFGDVIYCKYPSSKYRREYRFPLCEACLYIVKKKSSAAFPLFTPSHRPKLDPREIAPSRRLSGPSCMSVPEASPAHRSPLG